MHRLARRFLLCLALLCAPLTLYAGGVSIEPAAVSGSGSGSGSGSATDNGTDSGTGSGGMDSSTPDSGTPDSVSGTPVSGTPDSLSGTPAPSLSGGIAQDVFGNSYLPSADSSTLANGFTQFTTVTADPVNMVTGNLVHSERDISIKGRGGLPLVFERWYNSKDAKDGPLGFGWTHSFNHQLRFYGVVSTLAKVAWVDGTGDSKGPWSN